MQDPGMAPVCPAMAKLRRGCSIAAIAPILIPPAGSPMPPRSRLEKTLFRLQAQHACLAFAFAAIEGLPGPIAELGLGHGRTYDHLRSLLPEREIYAFDRANDAYPDCQPPEPYLILGDVRETVPAMYPTLGGRVILANTDLGTYDASLNGTIGAMVSEILPPLMAPGGIIMSDLPLDLPDYERIALPPGAPMDAYQLYRRPA